MLWLTWRRYRWFFLIAALLLIGMGIYAFQSGLTLYTTYNQSYPQSCPTIGLSLCPRKTTLFDAENFPQFGNLTNSLNYSGYLAFLPLLVGVFVGAPLLASERRSAPFLRTQDVTLRRWLLTKLGLVLLATVAFSTLVACLVSWWIRPVIAAGVFNPWTFYRVAGSVLVAQCVFAVILGTLIGVCTRATLPAMVVTFFVMVAVAFGTNAIYSHLLPASHSTYANSATFNASASGDLFISGGYANQHDQYVSDTNNIYTYCGIHISDHIVPSDQFNRCMAEKHLYYQQVYQPAQNYWPLQIVESALLVVLSLLGLPLIYWFTRRQLN